MGTVTVVPLTQPESPDSVASGRPSPTGPGAIASVHWRIPASAVAPGATTALPYAAHVRPADESATA